MEEIIKNMRKKEKVKYFLDTCFLINMFSNNHQNKLIGFCNIYDVGMSSFNLEELNHIHHKFSGNLNHHIRNFLKMNIISLVPINVSPGNFEDEKKYVSSFDSEILNIISDTSDAVMFVHALSVGADILTKDRHHVFIAIANNYLEKYKIEIYNELPN